MIAAMARAASVTLLLIREIALDALS